MLELQGVSRLFGGLAALNTVNMTVNAGKVVGLIGPNGAGKTTLINCVSGLDHPTSGVIHFDGVEIQNKAPHQITALGLGRTYQNIRLFGDLTVLENVIIAQHQHGKANLLDSLFQSPRHRREFKQQVERAFELLKRFHLDSFSDSRAGGLPYGDQRRLEMARAVATAPRLILLDEPTAGMNPVETHEFGEQILKLRDDGLTLLVIEHDMALISQVCDEVYVLNFGEMIANGTVDAIKQNQDVIEAYLGRED
ncbi:MAG: ABC transporter ATP-binding protein [Anaerolineae bacterium]|nr:MAG: ABC transporter ATP-binding protein [Anaerolineae bacterium]MCL4876948.1 ABC transporter ATP-binding protein [Anaerolineae bacterium]